MHFHLHLSHKAEKKVLRPTSGECIFGAENLTYCVQVSLLDNQKKLLYFARIHIR
jgi:hypothetical protein